MGFVFPASVLFSLVLFIASLSLFIFSKLKPNLYEESDNIYVGVGIVCGILLLGSLELGAAMAFQQLLLISATITLMWRFIQLRSENKQLKNRQTGTERPKSYNARLEDDYLDSPRERRQGKRRRSVGYEDEERLLGDSQESAVEPMLSRRRNRSFEAEEAGDQRDRERRDPPVGRRKANWEDETDWNDAPEERLRQRSSPRTPQRALPEADLIQDQSPQRFDRDRQDRSATRSSRTEDWGWNEANDASTTSEFVGGASPLENRDNLNEESTPRRRRNRSTRPEHDDRQDRPADSRSAKGSMASYVNYEPVDPDPPSGLPSSGSEPIVFPDRY
jgi:hypothetical protein